MEILHATWSWVAILMYPGIAGTPQGSVVVMTDAGWAGDVKDRRSYSGIAVRAKCSVENMWYPVYASSKKQNMHGLLEFW